MSGWLRLGRLIQYWTAGVFLMGTSQVFSSPVEWNSEPQSSADLQLSLDKLRVLGRVLYLAAHPDDENTRLIAQFARSDLYDTGYLSLTRGGGGQNLIGPELRDALGVIRTQELLAARRIDGGRQFFSRARDFGYSKNAVETFSIWDRQTVLSDVVWVIRKFKPDVIVTRFDVVDGVTHGHHTASAQLAVEAFAAAADPEKFPEQLEYLSTWQVKRVFWNAGHWALRQRQGMDTSEWLEIETGGYQSLLGQSPGEIAGASRSMHKSQGFGSQGGLGAQTEYLQLLAGEPASSLMEGVDISWNRVAGGAEIDILLAETAVRFDARRPWDSVPSLLKIRREMALLEEGTRVAQKLGELDRLIAGCLGLNLVGLSDVPAVTPGGDVQLRLEAINRSPVKATLRAIKVANTRYELNAELPENSLVTNEWNLKISESLPFSQPYWLRERGTVGMYEGAPPELRGLPENPPAFPIEVTIEVEGQELSFGLPTVRRTVDPVKGEVRSPLVVTPPVFLNFSSPVFLFAGGAEKPVEIEVGSTVGELNGDVRLDVPSGWRVEPGSFPISLEQADAVQRIRFLVTPPANAADAMFGVVASIDGQIYRSGRQIIAYDHIPEQTLFPPAEARAVRLNLKRGGVERIGYLEGAGDSVAQSLESVGYMVELLSPATLPGTDLSSYDAIVLGVRAYNTVESIDNLQDTLFRYVAEGGTLLVQYNTSHRLRTERLAPFSLSLSRDRVTDETAEVTFLHPEHRVLHYPNEITRMDFEGWVQERGLYFPNSWDASFTPILAWSDPGEAPLEGSLLVAPYGKGHFVYTGISFFRQLPAGVPGAYRLFVNLLSLSDANE